MQAPTHILAGVAIQRAFSKMRNRTLAFILVAFFAFMSHGFLDRLANLTYHPASADFTDPVWVIYHAFVLLCSLYFFYIFWRKYKWGIIFACLPDLDWVIIHGQKYIGVHIPFYHNPKTHQHIHNVAYYFYDNVWPFYHMNDLPNFRLISWTALFEVVVVLLVFILMRKRGVLERRSTT